MKFKIGNDIIETERIKKLCEKYGDSRGDETESSDR